MSFRESVYRTMNPELTADQRLDNSAFGLAGEVGEFVDLLKKVRFQGHSLDKAKALKELGDIRYYLELAVAECGFTMEEVERANVEKLTARYPDGFSAKASQERKA